MSSTSVLAVVAALSAPGFVFAQTQGNAPADVSPVVVTATLIPTPIDQVGSSITLITAQDVQDHQWRSVPDALQEVPGIEVVQSGGAGGQTSVFIRGANSNHTKVLIDGIEVNDPSSNDAFDFGQALTGGLARIEVLRGPQSSLYGSDALGGVINIVTQSGHGAPKLDATVEGGSFETFNQSAALSGSDRKLSYAFSVDHVHVGATPVTPLDLLAPGETRNDDRYDNLTLNTKLGFDVNSVLGFGLVARYVDSDLKFTSENYDLRPLPDEPDAAQTDQKERQIFTRAETRVNLFDGKFTNAFGIGYTDYHTRTASPDDGYGASTSFNDGDRLKLDWRGALELSKTETLVLGAEDRRDRIFGATDAEDSERAGFAELQSHPFDHFSGALSVRYDSDDRFGDKLTWRIAPAYTVAATSTLLKASYGTGFKAPTLNQLFVSFPSFDFLANPNLRPETSEGYDAGFEQPVFAGKLRFGVTGFHNAIRNLITDNADFTSYANIGRATTYGAETFVAITPIRQLTARVDYTYLVARDDIAQQELLRRPKTKIDFTAVWRPTDKLTLSATGLYVGKRIDGNRDFSIPRLTAGPYATFGVAGEYALNKSLTAFARIDNLADRRYEDPTGFQRPGIGAFGGIRLGLGGDR
jgi:vitamin B12 transporter